MPIKLPNTPMSGPVDTFTGTTFISFGFDRRNAPRADLTLDVRKFLDSPHWSVDGLSEQYLQEIIESRWQLIGDISTLITSLDFCSPAPIVVAIGCGQGRHRAPALAAILTNRHTNSRAIHMDYRKPSEK